MKNIKAKKNIILFTIIKYSFSLLLTMFASFKVHEDLFTLVGILELFIIFTISNILLKNKLLANIINSTLLLLYNVQMGVLLFSNTFITMIMLSNLGSIEALAGNASIYIATVIAVLVFSFLPIRKLKFPSSRKLTFLLILVILALTVIISTAKSYSTTYGYINLYIQHQSNTQLEKHIQSAIESNTINTNLFKSKIEDYRKKDEKLPQNPNIILIFTEGLAQHVVEDKRNIMSNILEYEKKSLNFVNYFNHTFATYRGLIGQLYSGYQLNNYDTNKLISLQGILKNNGYNTAWINSEPFNKDFTQYVNSFKFDKVLTSSSIENGTVSDKNMYELLFKEAENLSSYDNPFFISMYTFDTHVTLDSNDEKFEDGKNAELNKFYNLDYQFGKFMETFEKSELFNNTIIIFTSDHATYKDKAFIETFPNYERPVTSLDSIPFFIYYKGIKPEAIDVNGRNSICLAPTILDFLDISAPNFFIGTSLFSGKIGSICETSYSDTNAFLSTGNAIPHALESAELEEFKRILENYFITNRIVQKQLEQ